MKKIYPNEEAKYNQVMSRIINSVLFFTMIIGASASANTPSTDCSGQGSSLVLCSGGTSSINLFELLTGESAGGAWTMTAYGNGGTFDASAGTFIPDTQSSGVFLFHYSFTGDSPCGATSTKVSVIISDGDINDEHNEYSCIGDSSFFNLTNLIGHTAAGNQNNGTWNRIGGTGGIFDAASGTFDCSPEATSSTFVYTVHNACGTHSCTFNVYRAGRPVPGAGQDGELSVCMGNYSTINLYDVITNEQLMNPTWTRISGTGGIFDAQAGTFTPTEDATTSVFRYRMASGAGMCANDISFATINISSCETPAEGCGIGYWRKNKSQWCSNYSPNTLFGLVFQNAPSGLHSKTLLQVLNLPGSGTNNLARQAVASLLNICNSSVNFSQPYGSNAQSLISAANSAFASGLAASNALALQLDGLNSLNCPLQGSNNHLVTNAALSFALFPVPFNSQINVQLKFSEPSGAEIEILDSTGTILQSRSIAAKRSGATEEVIVIEPDFPVRSNSLYFVKVTTKHGTSVQKIMSKG